MESQPLSEARDALREIVCERGLKRLTAPVQLASGEYSSEFVDGKQALSRGADLATACAALVELVHQAGVEFDVVGGLTLGADQFAHGVAMCLRDDTEWFVIRKETKGRGTNKLVEGADIKGKRVLLVDDVVSSGGSIQQAYRNVVEAGGDVVMAVTLVDRGEIARAFFDDLGVIYQPLLTYRDLGIEPLGGPHHPAAAR
jgi:orotate phosphoribosyltransferase